MNRHFPGLPEYAGPTSGFFALLHATELFGWSNNVMERVEYVQQINLEHERKTWLHCMVWLDPEELPFLSEGERPQDESDRLMSECKRLQAEGKRLWAESDRLMSEGERLQAEGARLHAEGMHLQEGSGRQWSEGGRLRDLGKQLMDDSGPLLAECDRLRDESRRRYDQSNELLYESNRLRAEEVLAYVRRLVPDVPWSGTELVFD